VEALYNDFLNRNASGAEMNYWVGQLSTLGQQGVASAVIHSTEALTDAVDGFYVKLLGRPAVGGEEAGWVAMLQNGATEEQVMADIASTPEFAARANALIGGANVDANFVQALYTLLLNRQGSAAEVKRWLDAMPSGRQAVALGILDSPEYSGDIVAQYYMSLLDRKTPPGASEVNPWVIAGPDQLLLQVSLASSPEYFQDG
jgi:hypothetical protein